MWWKIVIICLNANSASFILASLISSVCTFFLNHNAIIWELGQENDMIDSKKIKFFCAHMGASCHHFTQYDKLPFFLSHIEHTNILKIARILHVHLTLFATRNLTRCEITLSSCFCVHTWYYFQSSSIGCKFPCFSCLIPGVEVHDPNNMTRSTLVPLTLFCLLN